MNKNAFGLALLCLAPLAPAAHADDTALHTQAQALLNRVAAAYDRKDVAGLVAMMAPGATITDLGGRTQTMAQWKANAEKSLRGNEAAAVKSSFRVQEAHPQGKEAVVTYTETHDFFRPSAQGQGHADHSVARFRATLVRAPQGWRFQRFVQLPLTQAGAGKAAGPAS